MNAPCIEIREQILAIARSSGHGHIPTCFSVIEVLWSLYENVNHRPADPLWDGRDLIVLSKGHGSLAHYAVLAAQGYFPKEKLATFGAFGSDLGCHADRHKVPGIEASTGSLGHGIGLATGMALALKIKKEHDRHVYVVIGDGEANEGSVWEAIMVAANQKLDNLTIILDNNQSHSRGLQIVDAAQRFGSFGCEVVECEGHDLFAITTAIKVRVLQKPVAVVAHTRKGYPCALLMNDQYAWHRRSPNDAELKQLQEELHA